MKRFLFGFILISIFISLIYFSYTFFNTPSYKIRFNSNGGSIVENIEVKANNKVAKLPITTKENYDFLGWYLNDKLFNVNMPITKNYILEAKWQKKAEPIYVIKFDTLTSKKIEPLYLKAGETIDGLPTMDDNNKTFYGWTYQNKVITSITAEKDMTLVALWHK